jgi:D-sedoheptulose 7-phosphate isomerase
MGDAVNAFERSGKEHQAVIAASIDVLSPTFAEVAALIGSRLITGGRVFICGNGGSAADAQHFAAELVGRYAADRTAVPVMALHTDTSALTAIANDRGYQYVFSRQLEAFAQRGDVLVALSTSGRSPNVIEAGRLARSIGVDVVAMTGGGDSPLAGHATHLLAVPSDVVARVQEVHALLLHSLAESVEATLLQRGTADA